jgi:hypothetical protein
MLRLRPLLSLLLFCSITFVPRALAQSTLTQIQDTVYNTDGSLFNGTLLVTWTGSLTPTGSSPAPYNTSVRIYNGALSVMLVPSTTASPSGNYQAVFSSSNGLVTWTETWQVPPASSPLNLSEIRTANSNATGPQIAISQVTGLTANLNAINGSLLSLTASTNRVTATVTSLSTAVTALTAIVNGLSAGTISTAFADGEVPTGTLNGTNATFTLAHTPVAPSTLTVYRNGVLLSNGVDYNVSGANITFIGSQVPQSNDVLQTYYRLAGSSPTPLFIDDEIPQGTIDGTNLVFTLSSAPQPLLSLRLYKNGVLLQENTDYTLNGTTVTFVSASVAPNTGDSLVAFYRITSH